MANTNRPRGFTPVGTLSGASVSAGTRLYAIPTSNTTLSFAVGTPIMLAAGCDTNGVQYCTAWGGATTTSALPVGIIVGVQSVSPGISLEAGVLDLTQTFINPSTRATVRYVWVDDNPLCVFEAQFDATGATAAQLGYNAAVTLATTTVHTGATPFSTAVLTTPAVTATLPIKLLGAVQRPDNAPGAYVTALCKWNYHAYFGIPADNAQVSYLTP